MARLGSIPTEGNTVLLFGPQALSFDEDSFRRLRSSVYKSPNRHWMIDTVNALPHCWDVISKAFPKLLKISGSDSLRELEDWFRNGTMRRRDTSNLPNIVLSPLVVMNQLIQYTDYVELANAESKGGYQDPFTWPQCDTETLGFCTGILSAIVVSCSKNQTDFADIGAVAVRLAMLVGALVDAQDLYDDQGKSISLATVWKSNDAALHLPGILHRFPKVFLLPLAAKAI